MRSTSLMILAAAALLAVPLGAAEETAAPGAEPQEAAQAASGFQPVQAFGLQVWFDPKTGQMRTPTPQEAAALSAALQQMFAPSKAEAEPVHHPDGTVSLQLDFGLMDFSVARVRSDGTIGFDCVGGLEQATELASQVADPEEE